MKRKAIVGLILITVAISIYTFVISEKESYTKVDFGEVSVNMDDAKYFAIANDDQKDKSIDGLFGMPVVRAKSDDISNVEDNELVIVDTNDQVQDIDIRNKEEEQIELGYTPLYIENRGDFTLTIAVHNAIFDEDTHYYGIQEELQWFLPLLLSSDDPISFMFNTGVSDFGYSISTFYDSDFGPALNLLIVNNKDGKVYDLSTTLFEGVGEEIGHNLRVDNLFVHEDRLVFSVHYELPQEFNQYPEIITLDYNYETEGFERSVYSEQKQLKEFTPVITDQYFNHLYISNHQYKILKDDLTIVDFPDNIHYSNTTYFLVDNEIYLLSYFFDDYEMALGKIDNQGQYNQISLYKINQSPYTEYTSYFETLKDGFGRHSQKDEYFRHYYDVESYGYKTYISDNIFYYISVGAGYSHKSIALEIGYNDDKKDTGIHLLNMDSYPGRGFFIGDKLYFVNETEIGYYDLLDSQEKEILLSNIKIQDYYMNLYYYFDEHIGVLAKDMTDDQIKYVLINRLTGEVRFKEENEKFDTVTYKTEIK